MRIRGFGLNLSTALVVLLMALLLAGLFTVVRPVVVPGTDGDAAQAAVYPCRPSLTRYRWVTNSHGGANWGVTIRAQIAVNGCDVRVVSGTQRCTWWGVLTSVATQWCGNYRLGTNTAYGQTLKVGGDFWVSIGWQGFPIGFTVHMCQTYDRWGRLLGTWNGMFYDGC